MSPATAAGTNIRPTNDTSCVLGEKAIVYTTITRIFSSWVFLLAASIVCLVTAPSAAETLHWELRRIGPSDSTSDCIGNPKTPVCAVETFIACWARHQMPLCWRVGVDRFSFTGTVTAVEYAIVYLKRLRDEDIPAHLKDADWAKPGYFDIQLMLRDCPVGQQTCSNKPWELYVVHVKPTDGRYAVVGWAGEGYPD